MRVYVRRTQKGDTVSDCCTVLPISAARAICTLCICSGRLQILPKEDDVMFYFFSLFQRMNRILFS